MNKNYLAFGLIVSGLVFTIKPVDRLMYAATALIQLAIQQQENATTVKPTKKLTPEFLNQKKINKIPLEPSDLKKSNRSICRKKPGHFRSMRRAKNFSKKN